MLGVPTAVTGLIKRSTFWTYFGLVCSILGPICPIVSVKFMGIYFKLIALLVTDHVCAVHCTANSILNNRREKVNLRIAE